MGDNIIRHGPEYDEKRLFCRMSVTADVQFFISGENKTYTGKCRNLSHSGIQFETEKALEEGTSLEITIDTKSKKFEPMDVVVEIIRVEERKNNTYKVAGKILEYKVQ